MKSQIGRGSKLCPLVVLCVLSLTLAFAIDCFAFGSSAENLSPLYLTIVVHQFW